jgi:hypothetical protein
MITVLCSKRHYAKFGQAHTGRHLKQDQNLTRTRPRAEGDSVPCARDTYFS